MINQNWYLIIKDFIIGFSALITVIVSGFIGLNIWKRQIRYKDEYDIAMRFMTSIYLLRQTIINFRAPFGNPDEISESLKAEKIYIAYDAKDWNVSSSRAVYNQRWEKIVEILVQIDVAKLEVELHWGKEIYELYNSVFQKVRDLHYAVEKHLSILHDGYVNIDKEEYTKVNKIRIDEGNIFEDDEFTEDLKTKIQNIENYIKGKIKMRERKQFRLLNKAKKN